MIIDTQQTVEARWACFMAEVNHVKNDLQEGLLDARSVIQEKYPDIAKIFEENYDITKKLPLSQRACIAAVIDSTIEDMTALYNLAINRLNQNLNGRNFSTGETVPTTRSLHEEQHEEKKASVVSPPKSQQEIFAQTYKTLLREQPFLSPLLVDKPTAFSAITLYTMLKKIHDQEGAGANVELESRFSTLFIQLKKEGLFTDNERELFFFLILIAEEISLKAEAGFEYVTANRIKIVTQLRGAVTLLNGIEQQPVLKQEKAEKQGPLLATLHRGKDIQEQQLHKQFENITTPLALMHKLADLLLTKQPGRNMGIYYPGIQIEGITICYADSLPHLWRKIFTPLLTIANKIVLYPEQQHGVIHAALEIARKNDKISFDSVLYPDLNEIVQAVFQATGKARKFLQIK